MITTDNCQHGVPWNKSCDACERGQIPQDKWEAIKASFAEQQSQGDSNLLEMEGLRFRLQERGFDATRSHYRARQAEMDRDDAFAHIHALWSNGQLPEPMTESLRKRIQAWGERHFKK